jgi:hypothetical protein
LTLGMALLSQYNNRVGIITPRSGYKRIGKLIKVIVAYSS